MSTLPGYVRSLAEMRPGERLVADANTGWVQHDAVRVAKAVRDVDVYIEQPCLTYEECLAVRRQCEHPFVLDENIDDLQILLRAKADLAVDVVNLKISKLGGLTKTRQARDLCISMGIAMTLEDSWGSDIITSAIAHLAHSTPPEFLFTTTDFNSYVTVSTADGAPTRRERTDGCVDYAWAWDQAENGCAWITRRRSKIILCMCEKALLFLRNECPRIHPHPSFLFPRVLSQCLSLVHAQACVCSLCEGARSVDVKIK